MVPFDWRILDRLGSIWRTYASKGVRLAPEEHSLTAIVPQTAAGAVSPLQTITMPMEGQFVWYGTSALMVNAAGVVQLTLNQFDRDGSPPQSPMVLLRDGQNAKTFARHKNPAPSNLSGWVPVCNVTGIGVRPYLLPFPLFFNPADFLELSFYNGTSGPLGLQLTFLGWKLTQ